MLAPQQVLVNAYRTLSSRGNSATLLFFRRVVKVCAHIDSFSSAAFARFLLRFGLIIALPITSVFDSRYTHVRRCFDLWFACAIHLRSFVCLSMLQ